MLVLVHSVFLLVNPSLFSVKVLPWIFALLLWVLPGCLVAYRCWTLTRGPWYTGTIWYQWCEATPSFPFLLLCWLTCIGYCYSNWYWTRCTLVHWYHWYQWSEAPFGSWFCPLSICAGFACCSDLFDWFILLLVIACLSRVDCCCDVVPEYKLDPCWFCCGFLICDIGCLLVVPIGCVLIHLNCWYFLLMLVCAALFVYVTLWTVCDCTSYWYSPGPCVDFLISLLWFVYQPFWCLRLGCD
jgi:hypothetical protein